MQVAEQTARGDADVGIATEALADVSRPRHAALLPVEPLRARAARPSAREARSRSRSPRSRAIRSSPTTSRFTGRSQINAAFDAAGLVPNVVLTALDSDVIKTYVEMGLGVGIIAKMAWDPARDAGVFEQLDAAHLFAPSTTRARAAPRDVPARLRLRFHRAVRAGSRPGGGRRRACRRRHPVSGEERTRGSARAVGRPHRQRAAADVVVRGTARLAVDAGAVRDRRLPAGVPGDRRRSSTPPRSPFSRRFRPISWRTRS